MGIGAFSRTFLWIRSSGSVGRYEDFTRDFLPRRDSDAERWARVERLAKDEVGLPPVDLFQIGDVYFVNDGNHRVSVARQMGHSHIEAYVTPVQSRVPLSPEVQPKDLILKAELADFLDCTRIDLSAPGGRHYGDFAGSLCRSVEAYRSAPLFHGTRSEA